MASISAFQADGPSSNLGCRTISSNKLNFFLYVNAKIVSMNTKSVSSPIGSFDAFYNQIGLYKLSFIGQSQSKHPKDKKLQKSIDNFFSKSLEIKYVGFLRITSTPSLRGLHSTSIFLV